MRIKFYREADMRWYADLPEYLEAGGTKEDCEMVGGADDWLDIIAQGEWEVTLELSWKSFPEAEVLKLHHTDRGFPELGATYRVGTYKGIDYSSKTLWLCPVTIFVFGEYPEKIYYK